MLSEAEVIGSLARFRWTHFAAKAEPCRTNLGTGVARTQLLELGSRKGPNSHAAKLAGGFADGADPTTSKWWYAFNPCFH